MVSLGWIFFRTDNLHQALTMLGTVFSPGKYSQFSLPVSLYIVTSLLMIGYLGYQAVASSLAGWRTAYVEKANLGGFRVIAVEMIELLSDRVWWWLAPVSLVTFVMAGIFIFEQTAQIAPFMYTLF
jgi:hypothetical protein